jgi:AbrB family looped-hinge helix DNA binding protein
MIKWYTLEKYRKVVLMETIVTSKGQVVIPSKIRRQLGVKEGTHLQIDVDESTKKIILTPITREYVHSLRGKYKGKGLLEALMADKQREKDF